MMDLQLDPDKTAQFVYNQKTRIEVLKEDNSIFVAGLKNDEEQWRYFQDLYSKRGDNNRADIIGRELERITSERSHYEQERQHLVGLEGIIVDLEALPGVQERVRRIDQAKRNLGIEGGIWHHG